MANTRVAWADVWKGILILLVILGHAFDSLCFANVDGQELAQLQLHVARQFVYGFHMQAFFLASGLFAGSLYQRVPGEVIKKRLVRVVRPYFFWGFIVALAMQLASGSTRGGQGLADWLCSPLLPFSEFWYLYVLFFIFLIHLALCSFLGEHAVPALVVLGAALYLIQPLVPKVWILRRLCTFTVFYALGPLILQSAGRIEHAQQHLHLILGTGIAYALAAGWYTSVSIQQEGWEAHYVSLLTAFAGAAFTLLIAIWVADALPQAEHVLAWCGRESLGIYVIHIIPLAATRIVILRLVPGFNLWALAAIVSVVALAFSVLAIVALKKTKLYSYVL